MRDSTPWKWLLSVSFVVIVAAALFMLWERRSDRPTPIANSQRAGQVTMSNLVAGGPYVEQNTHEELSASDVSEGKRLYHWFNCHTCHANGGGDIGPALMDDKWLYGAESQNIFASIVEGRPNGMPSFRGRIPEAQVWQLVAYIKSMSGHVPSPMRSGRDDDMQAKPTETGVSKEPVHNGGAPAPDRRSTSP